jgi:uncharacterized membrane protein HdeD (DUF308 family)
MADEKKPMDWGAITGAVILIAIAVGLVYYYCTSIVWPALGLPLLIFGVYELISSLFRSTENDRWGTSEAGAASIFGFIFIAIGGALIIIEYADSIIIPILFIIAVMVLYIVFALLRRRKN